MTGSRLDEMSGGALQVIQNTARQLRLTGNTYTTSGSYYNENFNASYSSGIYQDNCTSPTPNSETCQYMLRAY